MAKPTRLPTWADSSALIIDPGVSKQSQGWAVEMPPVQYFNWWMNLTGQWIQYVDTTLDAVAAQALNYDAVVGTGGTHATINAAIAALPAGSKILVKDSLVLTATQVINKDDIEIEFKPGVSIMTVDALALGIQITSQRVRLIGGRFRNFNDAPSDIALQFTGTAKNCLVERSFFFNNSNDLDDQGINTTIGTIVNEVA